MRRGRSENISGWENSVHIVAAEEKFSFRVTPVTEPFERSRGRALSGGANPSSRARSAMAPSRRRSSGSNRHLRSRTIVVSRWFSRRKIDPPGNECGDLSGLNPVTKKKTKAPRRRSPRSTGATRGGRQKHRERTAYEDGRRTWVPPRPKPPWNLESTIILPRAMSC